MSEFINKARIADLQHSNAELIDEISNLQSELEDLNGEIKRLREENPEGINDLRARVVEYEQRETEFNECILSLLAEVKNNPRKYDVVKGVLSVFPRTATVIVENSINNYYKNKWRPKVINSFLLGILVPMIFWIIVAYLENDMHYIAIIKKIINNVL